MKGLGELPVGLFLMILGLALTVGMITVSNVGAGEAVKPVNDLSKVVETKTQNQVFHNNYLITAAELSFQNGSDKVMQDEGGLSWTSNDYYSYDPEYNTPPCTSITCFITGGFGGSRTNAFVNNVEEHTNSTFRRYDFNLDGRCDVVNGGFEARVSEINDQIYSNVKSADYSATVRCENNDVETQHQYDGYYVSIEPEDNRFYKLFKDTNNYFHDLFDEWNSLDSTYSDSKRVCYVDQSDKEEVENNAVDDAQSDITTEWEDLNTNYEDPNTNYDGFRITRNKLEVYTIGDVLNHDVNYDADVSTYTSGTSVDCDYSCGEDNDEPCSTKVDVISDVELDKAKVNRTLTDMKYKVPTPDGWDNLEFLVEPYTHDLEQY